MPEEEMKVLRESYDHCWGEMEESIKGTPIQPGMNERGRRGEGGEGREDR